MSGLLLANSQKTQVEGCKLTFRRLLLRMLTAWSADRSIATSCLPRWMLISCVGAIMLRTTVYLPFADGVTPSSRKAGLPLRLIKRRNEKTTSADVSGVLSAKWTFFFSLNVNVFASFVADHDCTSIGTGCAMSPPL